MTTYQRFKQQMNYWIIGTVSLLALCFFPFIGTEVGMEWNIPDTTLGWIIYIVKNLFIAGVNVIVFHCFVQQAKINIKDNEKYQAARRILEEINEQDLIQNPRSPKQYMTRVYGTKATLIALASVLATISLTEAFLVFDIVALLSYGITLVFGFITGLLQMAQTEVYWTEEFFDYATKVKRDMELAKEKLAEQEHDCSNDPGRVVLLDAVDGSNCSCTNQPLSLGDSNSSVQCVGSSTASNSDTACIHCDVQSDD